MNAQLVKELREKTGVGVMECKKALAETKGNIPAAVEYLRKQGMKADSTRADHIAVDGIVASHVSPDKKLAVLLELNCETDFAAKNADFRNFAADLAVFVAGNNPASIEQLLGLKLRGSEKVSETINTLVNRIGEKISLRRFVRAEVSEPGVLGSYIHLGSKIGVLVTIKGAKVDPLIAKDIAMHVAASHPLYLENSEIPADVISREKEIYLAQLKDSGKSPYVLEKIVGGKMTKFASEVCLMDQIFIKDPSGKKSVRQVLNETDSSLKVVSFVRYQVGEGMEKKKDDFAASVMQMSSK